MATAQELAVYLADAELALHKLLVGAKEVSVGYEGKTVTYTQASAPSLRAYIQELKNHLGTGTPRRPLRPFF